MTTVSDTLYAELTDDDVPVSAKQLGGTTAGPYTVPPGMNFIVGINVQYSADLATTGVSGAVFKMSGDGLKGTITPVEVACGGAGATLATTHSTVAESTFIPTNMPCVAGADIDATFTMVGTDTGKGVATAEIMYSSVPRPNWPEMHYKTLEVVNAAVDAEDELEDAGSAKKFKATTGDNRIRQLIYVSVGDSGGTGVNGNSLALNGTGIVQDQVYCLDGNGGTHATEGNGHGRVRVRDVDVEIEGNQPITAKTRMNGDDTGNQMIIVTLGFAKV